MTHRSTLKKTLSDSQDGPSFTVAEKMIERMITHIPKWKELINLSFLPEKMEIDYCTLLDKRKCALDIIKKE